jgi:hypothetical protein
MFRHELKITGIHAVILKKYTERGSGKDDVEKVKLSTKLLSGKKEEILHLFSTYFDGLTTGMALGIKLNKKTKSDPNEDFTATIFTDKLISQPSQALLKRIYETYHFSISKQEDSEKIKSIFKTDHTKEEIKEIEDLLLSYAYAGLEFIDDTFKNTATIDEFSLKLQKFLND